MLSRMLTRHPFMYMSIFSCSCVYKHYFTIIPCSSRSTCSFFLYLFYLLFAPSRIFSSLSFLIFNIPTFITPSYTIYIQFINHTTAHNLLTSPHLSFIYLISFPSLLLWFSSHLLPSVTSTSVNRRKVVVKLANSRSPFFTLSSDRQT